MDRGISVRVYPELRAVHIERDALLSPADTWYFRLNDLDPAAVPARFHRVSLLSALLRLLVTPARVLEVPEPLWARFLPANLLLMGTWRFRHLLRRRDARLCTYAMENNEPGRALLGRRGVPGPVRSLVTRAVGRLVGALVDRMAFASAGAEQTYGALGVLDRVEWRTVGELPTASVAPAPADPHSVVFVGALEPRKGLPELLRAWHHVEAIRPHARLTIIGSGPLGPDAESWAALRPETRCFAGRRSHDDVLAAIAHTAVVVAPSVREGRWREQIGLPVKEGLAAGATVVTTDETGLASWLADHDHTVLPVGTVAESLAPAIVGALDAPRSRATVRASLPTEDGRITADHWLHGP